MDVAGGELGDAASAGAVELAVATASASSAVAVFAQLRTAPVEPLHVTATSHVGTFSGLSICA